MTRLVAFSSPWRGLGSFSSICFGAKSARASQLQNKVLRLRTALPAVVSRGLARAVATHSLPASLLVCRTRLPSPGTGNTERG